LSIENNLKQIAKRLEGVSETPYLDAQVLLADVLGVSRAKLLAHPDLELTSQQVQLLDQQVRRLESGQAFPYVLGHWEFFGLNFELSPDVLIPRPETELLVEEALDWLKKHPGRRRAVDIGTGSGCIAVSLAVNQPDLRVVACDISYDALTIARRNVVEHHLEDRVHLLQADLFSPFPLRTGPATQFDLICANPPYIPSGILQDLPVSRREPWLALDGGERGLEVIRVLLKQAKSILAEDGLLLLEIGSGQSDMVKKIAQDAFMSARVEVMLDLAGHDRLLMLRDRRA
jgi:release factor glutamine methyltransferase